MREVNGTHEVHIDGTFPFVGGGREKTLGWRPSGIGHANIGAAELLNHGTDEIADSGRVGDVERLGKDFRFVADANLFGNGIEGFAVAGTDCKPATFSGKSLSGGAANPLTGGGHNSNAISESGFHERAIIKFHE